ncbi:hypothetical protein V5G52_04110 [Trueperella pyogenes]
MCINIDESAYRDAGRALESLLGLYPQPAAPSDPAAEPETLASSVEEIIDNALSVALKISAYPSTASTITNAPPYSNASMLRAFSNSRAQSQSWPCNSASLNPLCTGR